MGIDGGGQSLAELGISPEDMQVESGGNGDGENKNTNQPKGGEMTNPTGAETGTGAAPKQTPAQESPAASPAPTSGEPGAVSPEAARLIEDPDTPAVAPEAKESVQATKARLTEALRTGNTITVDGQPVELDARETEKLKKALNDQDANVLDGLIQLALDLQKEQQKGELPEEELTRLQLKYRALVEKHLTDEQKAQLDEAIESQLGQMSEEEKSTAKGQAKALGSAAARIGLGIVMQGGDPVQWIIGELSSAGGR